MGWSYRQDQADVTPEPNPYFEYDFAVDGGAQGTIQLRGPSQIPTGFVITGAIKKLITALDSAAHTATAAVTTGEAANDVVTATIVSNAKWTTLGTESLTITKEMTTRRYPSIVIATQDLTAGKFTLQFQGYHTK